MYVDRLSGGLFTPLCFCRKERSTKRPCGRSKRRKMRICSPMDTGRKRLHAVVRPFGHVPAPLPGRCVALYDIPGRTVLPSVLNLVCPGGPDSRPFRLPGQCRACSPVRWSRSPFKRYWLNNLTGQSHAPQGFLPLPIAAPSYHRRRPTGFSPRSLRSSPPGGQARPH